MKRFRATGARPADVQRGVVRDRVQPRLDAANLVTAQQRRVCAEQGVLQGFLSVAVAGNPGAMTQQRPPVARDDHLEGGI